MKQGAAGIGRFDVGATGGESSGIRGGRGSSGVRGEGMNELLQKLHALHLHRRQ